MALLGAADIIDRSWEVVRRNLGRFLPIVGIFLVPSIAGTVAFEMLRGQNLGLGQWHEMVLAAAVYLPLVVLSILQTIALTRAVAAGITGEPVPPLGALLAAALPLAIPVFLASLALGILLLAGLVVLVVPMIIMAVWFAFILQAIVLDRASWISAFGMSKSLVTGRFGPVFWRLVAPYVFWLLVTWVLTALVVFLLNGAAGSFTVRLAADAPLWLTIAAGIATDAVGALMAPFFLAVTTLLYLNLKAESGPRA
ncbi:hypothetical protein EPO33_05400 [Patescibacteria group bacterium]|nr:MAG: hypothetical protein EPO33_05400 [Patescibacteria group bacterium]